MVITHHPLFLRGTDHVSATTAKGRSVHRLIHAGIALANTHTSWDSAEGGNADALAAAVGLRDTTVLAPSSVDPALGIGRVDRLDEPMILHALAERVAAVLPDSVPGLGNRGPPCIGWACSRLIRVANPLLKPTLSKKDRKSHV